MKSRTVCITLATLGLVAAQWLSPWWFLPTILAFAFHLRFNTSGGVFLWERWIGNYDSEPVYYNTTLFTARGWTLRVHKFVAPDMRDCFHSHPAVAFRLILWGGYIEEWYNPPPGFAENARFYRLWRPGHFGRVDPTFVHRVESLRKGPSYSLWLHGPKVADIQLYGDGWPPQAPVTPGEHAMSPVEVKAAREMEARLTAISLAIDNKDALLQSFVNVLHRIHTRPKHSVGCPQALNKKWACKCGAAEHLVRTSLLVTEVMGKAAEQGFIPLQD